MKRQVCTVSLFVLLAFSTVIAQQDGPKGDNPLPEAQVLGPQLIAWSEMQEPKPLQQSPSQAPTPDPRPETAPPQQPAPSTQPEQKPNSCAEDRAGFIKVKLPSVTEDDQRLRVILAQALCLTTIVGKISVFLLAENRLLREALAKILNKKTISLWLAPHLCHRELC